MKTHTLHPSVRVLALKIVSSHLDLGSAVVAANLVLDDKMRQTIEYIDAPWKFRKPELGESYVRSCTEAYLLEDGSVWYVTEGDLMRLHRLPANPVPDPKYYGLAYVHDGMVEFYYFAFPDTPRGRDILCAIQCGLNRPLAYYHNPRS